MSEEMSTTETKLKPCPFCKNAPIQKGNKYIVSHEETCFMRRHGRHTLIKEWDVSIWNRRGETSAK